MELSIRPARESDANAINFIFNQAIEDDDANLDIDCKDLAYRQRWLKQHDKRHPVCVGEIDGQVVAWASLNSFSERYCYDFVAELSIYVMRSWRNHGIGKAMLKNMERLAAQIGYYKIILSVYATNHIALHSYRRAGYRDVGVYRAHGYHKGKLIDIIMMERQLRPDMEKMKKHYSEKYPFYKKFFEQ